VAASVSFGRMRRPDAPTYAVGVDLVQVEGLTRKLSISPGLAARTFTAAERAAADGLVGGRRADFLAGRFAAKEAVLKALGVGISGGVAPCDVEVTVGPAGEPLLALRDGALRAAEARDLAHFTVSISHDGGFAIAFAVLA